MNRKTKPPAHFDENPEWTKEKFAAESVSTSSISICTEFRVDSLYGSRRRG